MSLKQDLLAAGAALRRLSPVVVHVPPDIRHVLLLRYMEMSMQNARLSLVSFGILLFGLAYEAPLLPRLAAWALLAAIFGVRVWRARRLARRLDPSDPRSDRLYDVLLLAASSVWGVAPIVLQPWVSPFNLFCAIYAAFVATALLAITYIAALPASLMLVGASVVPLVAFMMLQGSLTLAVLALGTLICALAMLMRVNSAHGTLLQALASERQNAALVHELQTYRRTLETENATLDSSLRAAARAANRDALTGLFNRRHIGAFAESLAPLVRAGQEEVTLCMIDVDHFKQVNDTMATGLVTRCCVRSAGCWWRGCVKGIAWPASAAKNSWQPCPLSSALTGRGTTPSMAAAIASSSIATSPRSHPRDRKSVV